MASVIPFDIALSHPNSAMRRRRDSPAHAPAIGEPEKKLEEISKQAKDAETREQARKALDKAKDQAKAGEPDGAARLGDQR